MRPTQKDRPGAGASQFIGGLMFTVVSVVFIVAGFWTTFSGVHKALTYHQVSATVDRVEGSGPEADSVKVTYSYQINGRQYSGQGFANEDDKSKFQSLRQYKAGQDVTIYCDPHDPSISQLLLDVQAQGLAFAIFALPFFAVGTNLLWGRLAGRELIRSKAISAGCDPVPGGTMFLVFLATCIAGAAGQLALASTLPWQWSVLGGMAIMFVAIPGINIFAHRLTSRSWQRISAAADANCDEMSTAVGSLGGQLAGGIFLTLFWCGITGVFCYFMIVPVVKHEYAKRYFATAEGRVISSRIKSKSGDDGPTYSPQMKYTYVVDSRQYTGDKYSFMSLFTSDSGYAARAIKENPVGKKVTVYYNPADPAEAILHLDAPPTNYFLLLFLQPFILVGLGLMGCCIVWPVWRRRLKWFLTEPVVTPWRIPNWGVMSEEIEGLVIQRRLTILGLLRGLVSGYGLTCFISIFVVGFLFNGFGDANLDAIRTAFIVAAVAGLSAMAWQAVSLLWTPRVVIDLRTGNLRVLRQRSELKASISNIQGLRLRETYPNGMTLQRNTTVCVLLEAVAGDDCIPLHSFTLDGILSSQNRAIATKVQRELEAIMKLPGIDTDLATPRDDTETPAESSETTN